MWWKWWTISWIRTTSVSVDGSSSNNRCSAGSASHSSASISAYKAALLGKCLNSNPSEIEAAAAILLVVVPAKPWRAKQRLAAARISCRRKSPVIRKVLMLVSKHSPYQMSRFCCGARVNGTKSGRTRGRLVVEYDNAEIAGLLQADGGETSVAGYHHNRQ